MDCEHLFAALALCTLPNSVLYVVGFSKAQSSRVNICDKVSTLSLPKLCSICLNVRLCGGLSLALLCQDAPNRGSIYLRYLGH